MAVPIAPSRNGNVLVYDLRYDVEEELGRRDKSMFPIVKELCYNKCPAVAPMSVLDKDDGWEKIGLTREGVERNLTKLLQHPEFVERMRLENESRPEFPPVSEPELALYDGFLDETDRIKVTAVRNADVNRLADFHPDFHDARLPGLLLHYKGRNFPEALSEKEMEEWERYRHDRLKKQSTKFVEELKEVYARDEFVAEELRLYFESLWTAD